MYSLPKKQVNKSVFSLKGCSIAKRKLKKMETENRFFYLQKYFNKEYIYYLNKINKVRNLVYVSFSVSKSKKKNQKNRLVDTMIGTMASKVRFLSVFHFLCINMTWQCEKIESLPHHKHSSSSTFTH